MTTYVALLRGINVSGHNKIKMADLRALFSGQGFTQVETYIQSGNIVFQTPDKVTEVDGLAKLIEGIIRQAYEFNVPVVVLSAESFNHIYKSMPLPQFNVSDMAVEGSKVLVSLLSQHPKDDNIENLTSYVKAPEQLLVKNNAVYLYCPEGHGKSKLSNNFIANKLKVNATTRNWKTMAKLHAMLSL